MGNPRALIKIVKFIKIVKSQARSNCQIRQIRNTTHPFKLSNSSNSSNSYNCCYPCMPCVIIVVATDKPPFLPMSFPFRFLRSIGRRHDGHLGTRTEEASADIDQKGGSLPFSIPSSSQAPAAYTTQHPNQWARTRLAYAPMSPTDPILTPSPEK